MKILPAWRDVGPGAMVAAAFIGPGTVTTATLAGAGYGVSLLWALLFSVLATLALQEMAARLGLVTGAGLGEAVRERFRGPLSRILAVGLVLSAIAVGNAAFEAGNLAGGALGAEGLFGSGGRGWPILLAVLAFGLLWTGRYRACSCRGSRGAESCSWSSPSSEPRSFRTTCSSTQRPSDGGGRVPRTSRWRDVRLRSRSFSEGW